MSRVLDILDEEERDALRRTGQPRSLQPMLAVLTDDRFPDVDWLKFKCGHGQELVIGGFTEPHGSRTGFDEEFIEEFRGRLDRVERKTSPFDDDVRESEVHWVRPRCVGEFRFTEWTDAGKLRHRTFLVLGRDKDAHDVVREQPR